MRRSAATRPGPGNSTDFPDDPTTTPQRPTASYSPSKRRKGRPRLLPRSKPTLVFLCIALVVFLHHLVVGRISSSSPWTVPPNASHLTDWRAYPRYLNYDSTRNSVRVLYESRASITETAYTAQQSQMGDWLPEEDEQQEVDDDGCVPRHEWMTKQFVNCQRMHEINMTPNPGSFVFINCGGDRCVFRMNDTDEMPIILKTQKYKSEFEPSRLERARHDSVAMERLSASKYVADIYGACGASQLVEFSKGGNLHDLIKIARLAEHDPMPRVDILRIGVQLATAVADMHSFEEDHVPSLTHQDLCCHQFLLVDGVFKLNDFHLGRFARKNAGTDEACPEYKIGYSSHLFKMRAPEEQKGNRGYVDHAKVDVFMLGNVLYYVFTKKWLFPDHDTDETSKLLKEGRRSSMPRHLVESDNPADKAMMNAIMQCWTHQLDKRPTARSISEHLQQALSDISGEKDGVVRVVVPPLPEGHRYTDSDFYDNFY